ncbi:protein of unknown function DUF423 [Methylocella silvestris BL2]|uniref:DUF423 domain-containing protein n=1 Tax=Methylocella silvestris (strain DSM 15510 / CIP 108128 / LMG 27833 / NCIMB 13906 / BL2) TaxID=395965 RepID=B8EQJ2_METSB|nr:DUF423 domain-containing protein [Methylocella silvestris]ACK52205.1 protein of unknown function DUF423 [Methylocella silvestris BL2]
MRMPEGPNRIFIAAALAGVLGAAGVILSAVGAHAVQNPLLATAANFLLIHALAILALAGIALAAPARAGGFLIAAALLFLGACLFCGDLAVRALVEARLFPMAAPIGGSMLICGWTAISVAALAALRPKRG